MAVERSRDTIAARRRLLLIRYARQMHRPRVVDQLLAEADASEDWRVLGYPTRDDYVSAADASSAGDGA